MMTYWPSIHSPIWITFRTGDVVGAGFFDPELTAETLLNKPYGSAEQNLFNFAYKLYNLKYLKATNQVREEIQKFGLERMNIGRLLPLGAKHPHWAVDKLADVQVDIKMYTVYI